MIYFILYRCFVHLVDGLRVSREGSDDYSKFPTVFPDFLWLLRDIILTPTDAKGNEIDARTFLLVSRAVELFSPEEARSQSGLSFSYFSIQCIDYQ